MEAPLFMIHPAIQHLIELITPELLFVQVLIQRRSDGFDLRHVKDRGKSEKELRLVDAPSLRNLAMFNERKAFRPLRCAPDLVNCWRGFARNAEELERCLEILYPGCIADWHAAHSDTPPITDYRQFTSRQSGMYRITTLLNDELAAQVASSCCDARFCLRQRLWTVGHLGRDASDSKSLAPCLEPCAILLELARKAMRLDQEEKKTLRIASEDLRSIQDALEWARENPIPEIRAGDIANPSNPRRLQLLLEKLRQNDAVENPGENP